MNEQSHKEEMSAAIRGDFQRLRERGVPVTLAPHTERPPDDEPRSEGPDETQSETARQSPPETPPETPLETPPADEPAPRRSWLARLAGR